MNQEREKHLELLERLATRLNRLYFVSKIIFDMDGVITTEQNYWNVAALTIWEHLFKETDIKYMEENTEEIRKKVFLNDRIISLCKNLGVNSNWDLAYIVYSMLNILKTKDFEKVFNALEELNLGAIELYDYLGQQGYKRLGSIWKSLQATFQEWYLGDENYYKTFNKQPSISGKQGLIRKEMPLFEVEKLSHLFENLNKKGYKLGIATGRPVIEITEPFKRWDFFKFFDENSIVTFSDVEQAEKENNCILVKPHPFMFLKAFYGRDYPNSKLISGDYDKSVLADSYGVGDAGADILSAQAAGLKFIAVLTGVSGESARAYFEKSHADIILNNVLQISEVLT